MKISNRNLLFICTFLLAFSLTNIRCTSSNANDYKGNEAGKVKVEKVRVEKIDMAQVAEEIAKEVGYVKEVHQGNTDRHIFVLEENHSSVLGQIELAFVLNRLAKKYDIKNIALEGYFDTEGPLKADWFHQKLKALEGALTKLPNKQGDLKAELATQFLQEGEISAAEFMTLLYPDVNIFGIEKESEYHVGYPKGGAVAINYYLYGLSTASISQNQYNKFEQYYKAKDFKEAFTYLYGFDPLTKEIHELINLDTIFPAEVSLEHYKLLRDKVRSKAINIEQQYKSDMNELIGFYEMVSQRSRTMVRYTCRHPAKNCAMIIGAAHTGKVVELLKKRNHSFAVIRPKTLEEKNRDGNLTSLAYNRKMEKRSVDTLILGRIISGNKKPEPILGEVWPETKTELYSALRMISNGGNGEPPNNTVDWLVDFSSNNLDNFKNLKIHHNTIRKDQYGLFMFKISIINHNGGWEELWVKTAQINDDSKEGEIVDIEQRLRTAMNAILEQNKAADNEIIVGDQKIEIKDPHKAVAIKAISHNAFAAISRNQKAVENARMGG